MEKRKIGEPFPNQRNSSNKHPKKKGSLHVTKYFLVIALFILIIFFVVKPLGKALKWGIEGATKTTIKIVSNTAGKSMQKDEKGNVNVLLMGYGWSKHAWGFLTDTIIIASWNTELNTVSLISFPRDLFVKNTFGGQSRINTIFTQIYGKEKDIHVAAKGFAKEMEKISGLSIPYYATIDFSGFEKLIDSIWGIDINVPETIHDIHYPNNNLGYETFHISQWLQHLDWTTALKYARSRHSTSDFSRSLRQQLIIEAIKNKILWEKISINKVKELYGHYTEIVNTNVSLDEILWTIQYLDGIHVNSFGLNVKCSYKNFKYTDSGCFLYNPSRELFGGAAVILPIGANPNKIDYYNYIQWFIWFITQNQWAFNNHPSLAILNGIDKKLVKQGNAPLAWNLAVKFKKFWINVASVANTENLSDTTKLLIYSEKEWEYLNNIKALKYFLPIDEVIYVTGVVKNYIDEYGNETNIFTGTDLELILGNSYARFLEEHPFNMETINLSWINTPQLSSE